MWRFIYQQVSKERWDECAQHSIYKISITPWQQTTGWHLKKCPSLKPQVTKLKHNLSLSLIPPFLSIFSFTIRDILSFYKELNDYTWGETNFSIDDIISHFILLLLIFIGKIIITQFFILILWCIEFCNPTGLLIAVELTFLPPGNDRSVLLAW